MPYPPINIEIFSTPPLINILKTPYPLFVNGGFKLCVSIVDLEQINAGQVIEETFTRESYTFV